MNQGCGSDPVQDPGALLAAVEQVGEDGSSRQVVPCLERHYETAVRMGASDVAALAALRAGWACARHGQLGEANHWAQRSLAASREVPDPVGELEARNLVGTCAAMRGEVAYARDVFSSALEVAGSPELRTVRAKLLVNLAFAFGLSEDAGRYEQLTREAIVLFRAVGDRERLANALVNLGGAQVHQGQLDQARASYVEAAECAQAAGDIRVRALAVGGMAEIDAVSGRPDAARVRFGEARATLLEHADLYEVGRLARIIGRHLLDAGDVEGALAIVLPEVQALERSELPSVLADLLDIASQCHESLGDDRTALQLLRRRVALITETLSSTGRRHAITPIQLSDTTAATERARACELVAANRALREALVREQAEKRRLSLVATLDPLTGVLNRRGLHDLLRAEFERCSQTGADLAVLSVDVDHFKDVNDTWGHTFGDEVLVEVARRIRGCVRALDLLGRVGGEEFVVVLPDSDAVHAHAVARRICGEAASRPFVSDATAASVTLSVGVASRRDDESVTTLLERSDRALYEAKRAGRNRVVTLSQD